MSSWELVVTIQLSHSLDEDSEFDAFTNVSVVILLGGGKVGAIDATIIHRQKIPTNCFFSAVESHSQELAEFLTSPLFEPRHGRTGLTSLAEYDLDNLDILYVSSLHIFDDDLRYKVHHEDSDVGAIALHQLLHHPFIQGINSPVKVSCAVYVLDPYDAMTTADRKAYDDERAYRYKQLQLLLSGVAQIPGSPDPDDVEASREQHYLKMDALDRVNANHFLRNGFFQDRAIAQSGRGASRILVASHGHWGQPMLSYLQAQAISFYVPPRELDMDLVSLVVVSTTQHHMNHPSPQQGVMDPAQVTRICSEITKLINRGASIARSQVLHKACIFNTMALVPFLLELEPSSIHGRDVLDCTPLMLAAKSAAGRRNRCWGITDTRVVDCLLAKGARKDDQDKNGMTAFGHLKNILDGYGIVALSAESCMPGIQALKDKLMPSGGPTESDLKGEQATAVGFVDYSEEDDDSEILDGESRMDDDDDDDVDGDY